MRNRTRVIAAAAAVAAALTAGSTVAAMASTTGAKPSAHSKTVSTGEKIAVDSNLAARLGVSAARLDQALRAVKTSLSKAGARPTEGQFDAALARSLGLPQARVRQAFPVGEPGGSKSAGSKAGGSKAGGSKAAAQPGDKALAAAVARELHVSTARVNAALRPIFAVGRADSSSAVFAAAARSLGISTKQLAAALASAKQSLAGGN
jgi:trimeric autotransporter adhesin